MVHRDRRGRIQRVHGHIQRPEDGVVDYSFFDGYSRFSAGAVNGRNDGPDVVSEISILNGYGTVAASGFRAPEVLVERTRNTRSHSLDIGFANNDGFGDIVRQPETGRAFDLARQDRGVATNRDSINDQLVGRRGGQTVTRGMPHTQVRDRSIPPKCDARLHGAVRFIVLEFKHWGACRIERYSLGIATRVGALEGGNVDDVE